MTLTPETAARMLAKFYNGQTTLSEERLLHTYLTGNDCPQELLPDRQLFLSLSRLEETAIPESLGNRIATRIDSHTRRRRWRRLLPMSIAAAVAVVFLIIPFLHRSSPSIYKDTCSSPQEAAVEVEQALDCVSSALAMGLCADDEELGPPCP